MQTKGEYRVGITFNPGNDDKVAAIKAQAALLIDMVEEACQLESADGTRKCHQEAEKHRLKALAQTAIEEGAMWAVKAVTKPLPA